MSIDPKLLEEIIREELEVVLVERIKKVKGGYKVFSKRGNRPLSKKSKSREAALRQMAAIEISKAKRKKMEEEVSPPLGGSGTTTKQEPEVPTGKLSKSSAVSASQLKKAELQQAYNAVKGTDAKLTSYERSLILDLENKIRKLASIEGVNLMKVRPKIEQALKILYSAFNSQIKASQQQTTEPQTTSTTSTTQQQTTTGIKQ